MTRKKMVRQNQNGFSLMELLMAIAMFSILLLISIESFWQAEKAIKNQDQTITRIRLIQSLINVMGMPASLRATLEAEGNTSHIWKCVRDPSTCPSPTVMRDLSVRLPLIYDGGGGTSTKVSGAISGPPGQPVLYSLDGVACDPITDGSCDANDYPISVSTQYDVICPPKYDVLGDGSTWVGPVDNTAITPLAGYCLHAHYFRIYYLFKQTPGASNLTYFEPVAGTILVNAVAVGYSR